MKLMYIYMYMYSHPSLSGQFRGILCVWPMFVFYFDEHKSPNPALQFISCLQVSMDAQVYAHVPCI